MRGIALGQHIQGWRAGAFAFDQHAEDEARTEFQHAGKAPLRIAGRWELSWEIAGGLQRVSLGHSRRSWRDVDPTVERRECSWVTRLLDRVGVLLSAGKPQGICQVVVNAPVS